MSDERDRDQGEEWWAAREHIIRVFYECAKRAANEQGEHEQAQAHTLLQRRVQATKEVLDLERMWQRESTKGN